ncbi:MAG: PAS domain-containing sensor histidine kinase [Ruminococcaceae bacterium]|nr:PAS domain-containing sensor histidine kinase [Oscillospiraceae bacterium]
MLVFSSFLVGADSISARLSSTLYPILTDPVILLTIRKEGFRVKKIRDVIFTLICLVCAFGLSVLFQYKFDVEEHITTVFVFAVFMISLMTEGCFYGVVSAFIGAVAVNYAFTFPYFAFDFVTPVNLISGIIMIAIAVLTSALTTKLKRHKAMNAESEKERMRANLLRAVSHDLRTPLTTIYGSSTTLLENGDTLGKEQKKAILCGIKEDAEWLVRMVENLLSITKIDSGQVKIIKTPTVLYELLDTVMLKFKKRYPDEAVELEIPDDVVIIPMDAILIEQVIVNILENAVQHAEGMTRLTLRVFTVGDKAVFEIEDDGCGIAPKKLDTLFTGYSTEGDEVADGQKKNAGIGLSVCATIIKAHGGSIEAENLKTGGSLFRFALTTEKISNDTE